MLVPGYSVHPRDNHWRNPSLSKSVSGGWGCLDPHHLFLEVDGLGETATQRERHTLRSPRQIEADLYKGLQQFLVVAGLTQQRERHTVRVGSEGKNAEIIRFKV